MTVQKRIATVQEKNACYVCLDYKHEVDDCRYMTQNKCRKVLSGGGVCGSPHHELLHEEGTDDTDGDQVQSEQNESDASDEE